MGKSLFSLGQASLVIKTRCGLEKKGAQREGSYEPSGLIVQRLSNPR